MLPGPHARLNHALRKHSPRPWLALAGLLLASSCPVWAQTSVLTYHNDIDRTGANTRETILTPANVNPAQFGKLFSQTVDGDVYAQPLYMPAVVIAGRGAHNVVFVATEADSVYAFDADSKDGSNSSPLWHASLIDSTHGAAPGATPVKIPAELGCFAILPQVGITSTPVIDPASGTLYVEAFSKEHGAFVHRLHALDIVSGAEKSGSPVTVTAALQRKGQTSVTFDALHQLNRPGLLLSNGTIYLAYGSHCDKPQNYGWLLAFDASTLSQKGSFVAAPTYGKAGIWMSGAAPAADDSGNVFLATGDGWFDAAHVPAGDVANSIVKIGLAHEVPTHNLLAHDRLPLLDYFTPFNQAKLSRHDQDLGSGGVLLARDPGDGHRQLLIHVGKEGTLYILDSNAFTAKNLHYCDGCGSDTQIMQELPLAIPGGVWGIPAYWNGRIYVSGSSDPVRAFSLRNGLVDASVLSSTQEVFRYPGAGLAISSEGAKNAILWTLEVGAYDSKGPAILRAYDATDLSSLLYASDRQAERDQAGGAVKFTVPTVVNGKVYVGGASQLTVFGSLSTAPSHLAAH